jgi:hypothetical protein
VLDVFNQGPVGHRFNIHFHPSPPFLLSENIN